MHDFLKSCRDEIAGALDTAPTDSWSDHVDWTYQEFKLPSGARIAVGLEYSDRSYANPRSQTGEPVLWVQVNDADSPAWEDEARWLVDHPPSNWNARLVLSSRPRIWQTARVVLAGKSIKEQREAVASAVRHSALIRSTDQPSRRDEGELIRGFSRIFTRARLGWCCAPALSARRQHRASAVRTGGESVIIVRLSLSRLGEAM
jgi:hypothetical protein